jgi:hypothetical protein
MPHERKLASSETAIRQVALERLRPFLGKRVSSGAVDDCCAFLAAEGTLRAPSLIVRCTVKDCEVATRIVVDKAISRWRLSECFLPFVSASLARFRGRAEFLMLLSDNLYPTQAMLPRFSEYLEQVPFLRCDWNDENPVSLQTIPIPDFHIQQPSYAEVFATIVTMKRQYPFEKRRRKVFWRGSLSGPQYVTRENVHVFPRYRLLDIARNAPAMIDARLTNYDDIAARDHDGTIRAHLTQRFGELSPYVPEPDLMAYKYAVSTDGAVAAWRRVPVILASGSVLLLQHQWKQFFYPGLRPWEHYVPVWTDISDLLEKYEWLEDHPAEAEAIASAGHAFAMRFLTPEAIESYFSDILLYLSSGYEA